MHAPRISAAVLAYFICTTNLASKEASQQISWEYGSVAFSANVMCETSGKDYVIIVPTLQLTFRPDASWNKVDSIRNPHLQLVTTTLRPGTTHGEITSKNSIALTLSLDKDHRVATVNGLRFVVGRQKVQKSSYTFLSLTDGHLLWPSSKNLKQCALSSNGASERTR